MARVLIVYASLFVLSASALAQPPANEVVIRLAVYPMAAPRPALRYQLLPELREMNPGNPIHNYLKCYSEQNNFFFSKQANDDRERYRTMALKDLPLNELKDYGGGALRQADYAARLDTPDWGILLKVKTEGFGLLLPDIQQMRGLAAALQIRFRAEVADKRFDDAIRSAKTMFALARHMGEHPTLIACLVGVAIAQIGDGVIDEMIGQPGCPNLFWALTDLPTPLVEMRKGLQSDRHMIQTELAMLDESAPMSEARLKKALDHIEEVIAQIGIRGVPKGRVSEWVKTQAEAEAAVKAGRKQLVAYGLAEDQVKRFPAAQIILLDRKRAFEERRDNEAKWMSLSFPVIEAGLRDQVQAMQGDDDALFTQIFATPIKIRRAQVRLEQRIALLRHVEAIRMHAAEHDGKLPAKLSDIKVPLPVDPVSGKPIEFSVNGETAVLKGSPVSLGENNPPYQVRYEVTIQK